MLPSVRRPATLPLAFVLAVLAVAGVAATPGVAVRSPPAAALQDHDPSAVEPSLALDRSTRRLIQQGLRNEGFDPGTPDGLFGPRTRAAIRDWQQSRRASPTGYLNSAQAEFLRTAAAPPPAVAAAPLPPHAVPAGDPSASPRPRHRAATGSLRDSTASPLAAVAAVRPPASASSAPAAQRAASPPTATATAEQENLFWQSIMNSTNPVEFEAYLSQFPNGVFRALAEPRLATLRLSMNDPAAGPPPAAGTSLNLNVVAGGDPLRRPGDVFRDCETCPEMVVLPGGDLAMGRYEVTVGEYLAFASATGAGAGVGCSSPVQHEDSYSWREPGFPQTDRHPVTCVNWTEAQEYVSWLSRRTGATYRLPTDAEWGRASAGSPVGVGCFERFHEGTCPVGSYSSNASGLSDMLGNVWEWVSDCYPTPLRPCLRGGTWSHSNIADYGPHRARTYVGPGARGNTVGFRVSRTLE